VLKSEDLVRRNPYFAPPRPQRWSALPEGCRPLREGELIERGDIMRVADGWFEQYAGYSLLGTSPGPKSKLFPPTWYRPG
jgi:hypothetical protein